MKVKIKLYGDLREKKIQLNHDMGFQILLILK